VVVSTAGNSDAFLAKVNSNGTWGAFTLGGGSNIDSARSVAVDPGGDIFLVGEYRGTAYFGSQQFQAAGSWDMFAARISPSLNWNYTQSAGGSQGGIVGTDIAAIGGEAYVGGYFSGTVYFDSTQHTAGTQYPDGVNGYVAKLGRNGTWDWVKQIGGHRQVIYSMAPNPVGGVWAAGFFESLHNPMMSGSSDIALAGIATFGNIVINSSMREAFIAHIDAAGNWQHAEPAGGAANDDIRAIDNTTTGGLVAAGGYCIGTNQACMASIGGQNLTSATNNLGGRNYVWGLLGDQDGDNIPDTTDNCPTDSNTNQSDIDSDTIGDVCDPDMDGDGFANYRDGCDGPAVNWPAGDPAHDMDGDGCRDIDEDLDDDNDNVNDRDTSGQILDLCSSPTSKKNWSSNTATDHDGDGCNDLIEDDDDDNDGVLDTGGDLCPRGWTNWTSDLGSDYDGDGCADAGEDDDDDGDDIFDSDALGNAIDGCPRSEVGWLSNLTTDADSDGCRDSDEDDDDDGDGKLDEVDDCSPGAINWISAPATDMDSDGCRDFDEDLDDDGDLVNDIDDDCPNGDSGWFSNIGTDKDGDGCRDAGEDMDDDNDHRLDTSDQCSRGLTGWISNSSNDADEDGCKDGPHDIANNDWGEDVDDDNDLILDREDQCPDTAPSERQAAFSNRGCGTSQTDSDGDGIQNSNDVCPDVAAATGFDVDADGCTDDRDEDGVLDDIDGCLNSPLGSQVASDGCTDSDRDTDGDGIPGDDLNGNGTDQCPQTAAGAVVDAWGCAESQYDMDADGVSDAADLCPDTSTGQSVDSNGCAQIQRDSDADGVKDLYDQCADSESGATVDVAGCSAAQRNAASSAGFSNMRIASIGVVALLLLTGGVLLLVLSIRRRKSNVETPDQVLIEDDELPSPDGFESTQSDSLDSSTAGNHEDSEGESVAAGVAGAEVVVEETAITGQVDDEGYEWWEDEVGVWWYRTPPDEEWSRWEA
jgi:hypothetical protein